MRQIKITQSVTVRTQQYDTYVNTLKKGVLTPEEEYNLFVKYKTASSKEERNAAKNEIIERNLFFVISIAKKYSGTIPLMDLIQEGNEGLIEAVDRFDETKGFKFISYAVWWIRQRIGVAIYNNGGMIYTPKAKKSVHENIQVISLNEPLLQYEGAFERLDMYIDEEAEPLVQKNLDDQDFKSRLMSLVNNLPEKQRRMIDLKFGLSSGKELSFNELAEILKTTPENIRVQVRKAIQRLNKMGGKELRQFI